MSFIIYTNQINKPLQTTKCIIDKYFQFLKILKLSYPFSSHSITEAKAKAAGLWTCFSPAVSGLTQWEFAHIAEVMGDRPLPQNRSTARLQVHARLAS